MIKGKRVTLRGLELEDAKEILKHFNDLEVRQFLGRPFPISHEEEEKWIRNTWEARRKGHGYQFGIELNKNKLLIGACGLEDVHRINRSAELGIAIWNKPYWSKGFGTEAIELLLRYGFYLINLHSVYLTVVEDNKRAIRAYEKVGFKHAALQRETIFQDGHYKNLIMMDILKEEFQQLHPPTPP